jgi:hypothetical protein
MDLLAEFKNVSLSVFLEKLDYFHFQWIVKRLSGNDTGLTGGHQVGLYLPKTFIQRTFSEICHAKEQNPHTWIKHLFIPQVGYCKDQLRVVYYNNKLTSKNGTRNEFRITKWGGKDNPLQDEQNTGSICIFGVAIVEGEYVAVAWVADNIFEEDFIELWLGEAVEPGHFYENEKVNDPNRHVITFPDKWRVDFPSGRELFDFVLQKNPRDSWKKSIDLLLMKRREYEFKLFSLIEEEHVLPSLKKGFSSVDEFIKYSLSVANRRKSRTGTSLEMNLEALFCDEKIHFESQVTTENKKKPDFLFPSEKAYHCDVFPSVKLHMLAAKTCCKDRWRQVISEANRIKPKHLFTLQEGISSNQLKEMEDELVKLVVPEPSLKSFPNEWRSKILTLEGFVSHIRNSQKDLVDIDRWIN